MISEDFYKFNLKMLENSSLPLHYKQGKTGEKIVDVDGKKFLHVDYYESISLDFFNQATQTNFIDNPILGIISVFSVFEIYLDNKYKYLKSLSTFRARHDNLPKSTNTEIVQKSFYRIFKIIRNAITHDINSISYQNGFYKISYYHHSRFYLEIGDKTLLELYTATLLLIDDSVEKMRGIYFKQCILLWYYNSIIANIKIKDDCKFVSNIGNPISLNPRRDVIINAEYKLDSNSILIENSRYLNENIRHFAISTVDKCYVIPQECLDHHKILVHELFKWKADKCYLTSSLN